MRQQPRLRFESAAETRERPAAADDPVTGRDDGDGIAAVCGTDRADGGGIADGARDVGVGARFAAGDGEQLRPYLALEIGAAKFEREIEGAAFAREVLVELVGGRCEDRVIGIFDRLVEGKLRSRGAAPDDGEQGRVGGEEVERADGGRIYLGRENCRGRRGLKGERATGVRNKSTKVREEAERVRLLAARERCSSLATLGTRFAVRICPVLLCKTVELNSFIAREFESHPR